MVMHVMVLGAGVAGVTTAYYLTQRGHQVTVVDRCSSVAEGASGHNGGQLSYSFTDAMGSPTLLYKLPGIIANREPAFRLRPDINWQWLSWGANFLLQCTRRRYKANTEHVLKLALRSADLMEELRQDTGFYFAHKKAGKLVMLDTPAACAEAEKISAQKRQLGCEVELLTAQEALKIEPALEHIKKFYAGAIYAEHDAVGDTHRFTIELATWLAKHTPTEFMFNTTIQEITAQGNRQRAVQTDRGPLEADAVVVCLGAWSDSLLKSRFQSASIYPVRGYSLTLPCGSYPNRVSVTDLQGKLVFSRLDQQIRVAGFADFCGYRARHDEARIEQLLVQTKNLAPGIADYSAQPINSWGGFRPMTPDSRPIVGPCRLEGLFVNTGHGMLGWTLACATAHQVAACV